MKWWVWLVLVAMLAGVLSLAYLNFKKPKGQTITDEPLSVPHPADVEALGRMIASENNGKKDTRIIKVAIAWAAKNMAARVGKSVDLLLMPDGNPGEQAGRYASTRNPATTETRAIANSVLSGQEPDPTGGSIQFDAPGTQDILYATGRVRLDAAGVAASRMSEGKEVVYIASVDPNYMRWWRKV